MKNQRAGFSILSGTHIWAFCILSAAFFQAGCTTGPFTLTTEPPGAAVYSRGHLIGQTPVDVNPLGVTTWYGIIKKDGFVNVPLAISRNNPAPAVITLEKDWPKIKLCSVPNGADVLTPGGTLIGQTPLTILVNSESQSYQLRLLPYEAKTVVLTPESDLNFEVNLGEPVPGCLLPETVIVNRSLQIRATTVYADRDVIEHSPSVRAVHRLTDFPKTRIVDSSVLSPDGKRLMMAVFDQEREVGEALVTYSSLWSVDTTSGGNLTRNTDGLYIDESPCFSPDGRFVYFESSRAGKNSIFRLPVNGNGLGLITSGTTIDRYPQVSPNGGALMWTAFTEDSSIPQLWSLALENGLPTGLPLQIREGEEPRWSPDGKKILCNVLDRNLGKWKIWTIRPDGSEPTQLTTGSDANDIHAAWSPDGSKIVFASDRGTANGKPNFDIWIMNADGSNPKQLTTNGSRDDHPTISPDGKTIYFRSNRGLKWDIWTMELAE